jgi:hypothetical protein
LLGACCAQVSAGEATIGTDLAAAEATKTLQIQRTAMPPTLDGALDEPVWVHAAVIDQLYQIRPGNGTPASERTEMYFAYDDNAIYVGARVWDPASPKGIAASVMKHGAVLRDDDRVDMLFDTFNTQRSGYRFGTNANGVRHEQLVNGDSNNADWTAIWEVAAKAYDGYWIAEFAIPFKTLPFDPRHDTWGLNVSRTIRRRAEEAAWVVHDRRWGVAVAGSMSGLTGMKQGLGLDVVPGVTVSTLNNHASDTRANKVAPSLDAYYRLTPSLNASVTFNTDFSATEVDDRQVNLGRFGLFFPEKRDFFLNDGELFEFGRVNGSNNGNNKALSRASQENGRPFFSRRLGLGADGAPADIQYGAKLSGRAGRWSIGALAIEQDDSLLPGGGTLNTDLALVARLSANVLAESTVGGIITSGNTSTSDRNSLIGLDFIYKNSHFKGTHTLAGELWAQKSTSANLHGRDSAFGAGLSYPSESGWRAAMNVRELQENFSPALGYVNVTGVRQYAFDVGYNGYPARKGWLYNWYAGIDTFRLDDIVRGGLLSQTLNLRAAFANSIDDTIAMAAATMQENVYQSFSLYSDATHNVLVPAGRYRYSDTGLFLETGRSRKVTGGLSFTRGAFYNGHYSAIGAELGWKQSRHFTMSASGDWNHIRLPSGSFVSRLMRLSTDVGFTPRMGWTSSVQFDNNSTVLGLQTKWYWIPQAGQRFNLVLNHAMQDPDRDRHFTPTITELSARASYTLRY